MTGEGFKVVGQSLHSQVLRTIMVLVYTTNSISVYWFPGNPFGEKDFDKTSWFFSQSRFAAKVLMIRMNW